MDFDLSEEHRLIQETAYRFAIGEIAPQAKECDRAEKYPREIVRQAAELGFVGPTIPEEYGGAGYGFFEHSLIVEQMARVDLGITQAIESAAFGSQNIVFFGTEEQKQKYLPPLAAGEMIAAGAYTEPDAGTDIAAARTKAVREGEEWVITGNKMFITNGTVCDFMAVFCLTDPAAASPYERHSLILVESGLPGLTATPIKGKMGLRASDTAEVAFEGVRVPAANLIGKQGQGFKQLMHFFDATRTVVASQGVGLAGVETKVRVGDPAECIVAQARAQGSDLIVMGTHGRRGLEHAIFGSVAEKVVKNAATPVLTINPHRI